MPTEYAIKEREKNGVKSLQMSCTVDLQKAYQNIKSLATVGLGSWSGGEGSHILV